jgi:hypothetical protein
MSGALEKLISISANSICRSSPELLSHFTSALLEPLTQLQYLLKERNGFYAFESALHVFPSNCDGSIISVEKWNETNLWKASFKCDLDDIIFFAEDIFGGQFGIKGSQIVKFEPEQGETSFFAENINGWALKLISDYDYETGYPLAAEWQKLNGPILEGKRLLPKTPFILGGQYEVSNLYSADAIEGMRFRADLFNQIKDLPDGEDIKLDIIE